MNINEIFGSLNGEVCAMSQGSLCTFLRLQGCNAKCTYCFGVLPGRRVPKIILSTKANKKLPDVQVGDKLLTFDENKCLVETTVIDTMQREVDKWIRITINKVQYFVTEEHPFFTTNGLKTASELVVGDMIYHSDCNSKLTFRMQGKNNPMKNEESIKRRLEHTDYKASGKKLSATIQRQKQKGTFKCMWDRIKPEKRTAIQKKISDSKKGELNPNWKEDYQFRNYNTLKKQIRDGVIVRCSVCGKDFSTIVYVRGKGGGIGLDVHHKDKDHFNDSPENLEVSCESCHYSEHEMGYNFWKGPRSDGKQLNAQNGFEVTAIKLFDRNTYRPSQKPDPLKVYNLTCAPYNSYLIDYMWVHNCDTAYAQNKKGNKSKILSVDDVFKIIQGIGNKNVTITGGEPLIQLSELAQLCLKLVNNGNRVSIETNGSIKLPEDAHDEPHLEVWKYVNWVVDYKLPSSGMEDKMCMDNFIDFDYASNDFIKFVIADSNDFRKAKSIVRKCQSKYVKFAMSAVKYNIRLDEKEFTPSDLLEWMMKEPCLKERGVILNLQLHKILHVK